VREENKEQVLGSSSAPVPAPLSGLTHISVYKTDGEKRKQLTELLTKLASKHLTRKGSLHKEVISGVAGEMWPRVFGQHIPHNGDEQVLRQLFMQYIHERISNERTVKWQRITTGELDEVLRHPSDSLRVRHLTALAGSGSQQRSSASS